jgi:hypothetical protein
VLRCTSRAAVSSAPIPRRSGQTYHRDPSIPLQTPVWQCSAVQRCNALPVPGHWSPRPSRACGQELQLSTLRPRRAGSGWPPGRRPGRRRGEEILAGGGACAAPTTRPRPLAGLRRARRGRIPAILPILAAPARPSRRPARPLGRPPARAAAAAAVAVTCEEGEESNEPVSDASVRPGTRVVRHVGGGRWAPHDLIARGSGLLVLCGLQSAPAGEHATRRWCWRADAGGRAPADVMVYWCLGAGRHGLTTQGDWRFAIFRRLAIAPFF